MSLLGYRPTKKLKGLLEVIRDDLKRNPERWEHYVSWTVMTDEGMIQVIEMDLAALDNHIIAVMKGLSPALKEEEYRTQEACLAGEAEKLGMVYRFDYIECRWAFRLRRPSGEHSDNRGEGAPRNRQ